MSHSLVLSSHLPEHILLKVADLLVVEWQGSQSLRLEKLKNASENGIKTTASYILILNADVSYDNADIIGHVEIKPSASISSNDELGNGIQNVIALSVYINPIYRGQGHGKILMNKVEDLALSLGFSYLYLWTDDAVMFYKKCGYHNCESLSIDAPVFNRKQELNISKFELLLQKRLQSTHISNDLPSTTTSSTTAPTSTASAPFVWLRKRLNYTLPICIPSYGSGNIAYSDLTLPILSYIKAHLLTPYLQPLSPSLQCASTEQALSATYPYYNYIISIKPQFPVCRQIGPSCGIAALTSSLSYLAHLVSLASLHSNLLEAALPAIHPPTHPIPIHPPIHPSIHRPTHPPYNPSEILLREAIERGYSFDGEIFDIHHLYTLLIDHIASFTPTHTHSNTKHTTTRTTTSYTYQENGDSSVEYTEYEYMIDKSKIHCSIQPFSDVLSPHNIHHLTSRYPPKINTFGISITHDSLSSYIDDMSINCGHNSDPSVGKPHRLVIFPYDRDVSSNKPGLYGGSHAHYGVIIGTVTTATTLADNTHTTHDVVESCDSVMTSSLVYTERGQLDTAISETHSKHASADESTLASTSSASTSSSSCSGICNDSSYEQQFLVVQQSMSIHPVTAPLPDWLQSNQQLHTSYPSLPQEKGQNYDPSSPLSLSPTPPLISGTGGGGGGGGGVKGHYIVQGHRGSQLSGKCIVIDYFT